MRSKTPGIKNENDKWKINHPIIIGVALMTACKQWGITLSNKFPAFVEQFPLNRKEKVKWKVNNDN